MLLNDTVSYRQAKSGAPAYTFSRKEGIVNFDDVVGRDADAGVGYFNQETFVVSVSSGQRNAAITIRDRIARIENEIGKDLL